MSIGDTLTMDTKSVRATSDEFRKFLTSCFTKRVDPDQFLSFAQIHQTQWPASPMLVSDLLLRPTPRNTYVPDMLVPQYIQRLLKAKLVTASTILCALYRYSTSHTHLDQSNPEGESKGEKDGETTEAKLLRWTMSWRVEDIMFYMLAKAIRQEGVIKSVRDALDLVRVLSKWTTLMSNLSASLAPTDVMGMAMHSGIDSNTKQEIDATISAFAVLLLGVCEDAIILRALNRPAAKDVRRQLSEAMAEFAPYMPHQTPDITTRLEIFRTQTLVGLEPVDKKKQKEDEDAHAQALEAFDQTMGLDNFQVSDLPVENTRAGLYIYLNAALVALPLIDDAALFSYLHNRYQGDLQTTAIHLILASFDVLANAVFRDKGTKSGHLLKSYLINKVPLLLTFLANSSSLSYVPFNSELCIVQALNQVDTNVFPTLSGMFDMSSTHNSFTESVRQEFFFACLLHGLVSESARDKILGGEITFQELPRGGRYTKAALVQECLHSTERMKGLIGEIEGMDGNAGAVCQALAEVLVQLCQHKDTMSLKQWCSQLARRPKSLDVLMLFNRPEMILQPLCELLDNWRYDENREDQGEYQLMYEEFSSILLLLLSLAYRYGLSVADLKIRSPESFVGKLLSKRHHARHLDDLSERELRQIKDWVHGLFDLETNGLGDELMSGCSPQDFYLLIPTLFEQVVLAFSTGALSEEQLKGGLEYLVDPFLLPSLTPALLLLCNHLWTDRQNEQRAVIRILQLTILSNTISNEEASGMLSAVLTMVAFPLEGALRSYLKRDPKNQDIDRLLRALRENLALSRCTPGADINELVTWTNGGLAQALRHITQHLIAWCHQHHSTIDATSGMPPSYSHRQINVAIKMCGAKTVLSTILDDLQTHTDAGNGGIAYDVATALICASDMREDTADHQMQFGGTGQVPSQFQHRLSLRTVLKREAERWKKMDHDKAEIVVRLYRRVEAQMVMQRISIAQPPVLMNDMNLLGTGLGGEMNVNGNELGDAIQASAGMGIGLDEGVDLSGAGGGGGGVGDIGAGAGGTGGLGSASGLGDMGGDDIFSGLGDVPGGFDLSDWGGGMDLA